MVRSLFSRSLTIDCQPVTIKRKRESDEFSEKQAAKKRKGDLLVCVYIITV